MIPLHPVHNHIVTKIYDSYNEDSRVFFSAPEQLAKDLWNDEQLGQNTATAANIHYKINATRYCVTMLTLPVAIIMGVAALIFSSLICVALAVGTLLMVKYCIFPALDKLDDYFVVRPSLQQAIIRTRIVWHNGFQESNFWLPTGPNANVPEVLLQLPLEAQQKVWLEHKTYGYLAQRSLLAMSAGAWNYPEANEFIMKLETRSRKQ